MLTLLSKGVQTKLLKFFSLKVFAICHRCRTPVANLELRISPRIFEKIRNSPNVIIRGLGETDSRKITEAKNLVTLSFFKGCFFYSFQVFSKLIHLPPLRLHCVEGLEDRTRTDATVPLAVCRILDTKPKSCEEREGNQRVDAVTILRFEKGVGVGGGSYTFLATTPPSNVR